jgi:hypothetical protein
VDLNGRNSFFLALAGKPNPCFAHIENLPLLHQRQHECICNSIATTDRTISFLPWAMTLNAFSDTCTNKTAHGVTIFLNNLDLSRRFFKPLESNNSSRVRLPDTPVVGRKRTGLADHSQATLNEVARQLIVALRKNSTTKRPLNDLANQLHRSVESTVNSGN